MKLSIALLLGLGIPGALSAHKYNAMGGRVAIKSIAGHMYGCRTGSAVGKGDPRDAQGRCYDSITTAHGTWPGEKTPAKTLYLGDSNYFQAFALAENGDVFVTATDQNQIHKIHYPDQDYNVNSGWSELYVGSFDRDSGDPRQCRDGPYQTDGTTAGDTHSAAPGSAGECHRLRVYLNVVYALALDSRGDLYFGGNNLCIRKLDMATDMVTVVAGSTDGSGGSNVAVDGATRLASRFNNINGLAFDPNKDLIVNDGNSLRRVFLSKDEVRVILLGPDNNPGDGAGYETSKKYQADNEMDMYGPAVSFAPDTLGTIYWASYSNHVIRSITPAGQEPAVDLTTGDLATKGYTTIVGDVGNGASNCKQSLAAGTNALIDGPAAVALDPTGTLLYFSQYSESVVSRVDLSNHVVSHVVGGGCVEIEYDGIEGDSVEGLSVGVYEPGHLAFTGEGDLLVMSDTGSDNTSLRKITGLPSEGTNGPYCHVGTCPV